MQTQVLIALASGSLLSGALCVLSYLTRFAFLFAPQVIGFYACMMMRGIHTATTLDYILISVPINAIVYAVIVFAVLRMRTSKQLTEPRF